MPNTGTYQRNKPRIQVVKGFDPQNTAKSLIRSAPVKSGETILSGQVCSLVDVAGSLQFIRGYDAVNSKGRPYFAYGDSTDTDVLDAEKLAAFNPGEDLVIETPYFKAADTYAEGTPVTVDGTTGDIKAATAGTQIVGHCEGGVKDVAATNNTSIPANSKVLRIKLTYIPVPLA